MKKHLVYLGLLRTGRPDRKRVVKHTRIELKAGVAGDNVAVPILLVDRGCGDPILGIIVNRNLDDMDQHAMAIITATNSTSVRNDS